MEKSTVMQPNSENFNIPHSSMGVIQKNQYANKGLKWHTRPDELDIYRAFHPKVVENPILLKYTWNIQGKSHSGPELS